MADIPENHQAFCREIAALAKKHGLSNVSGRFRPGYADPWRADITFVWDEGRHGAEENRIRIASLVDVVADIDGPARA